MSESSFVRLYCAMLFKYKDQGSVLVYVQLDACKVLMVSAMTLCPKRLTHLHRKRRSHETWKIFSFNNMA